MVDYIEVDMKEFIAGCAKRFCPTCGQEIKVDKSGHTLGRPRKFCSDICRQKFWKAHPKVEVWASYEQKTCPVCGESFYAQHENRRERKYCSRACANRGRAGKGGRDDGSVL